MPEEVESIHKYSSYHSSIKHQASSFKLHPITESKAVKEAFKHVVLEGALVTLLNTGIVHSVDAKPGSLLARCDISSLGHRPGESRKSS